MTSKQSEIAARESSPDSTAPAPAEAVPAVSAPATGVLVGVDDSRSARAAVAWAAAAADSRGVGLDLVQVLPGSASEGAPISADPAHGRARALLWRAQATARSSRPNVPIGMHTLYGKVAPALVEYAANAQLLVVGCNGPGGPIPLSLGAIVGGVTRRCPCPVVLVPAASSSSYALDGPVVVALEDSPDGERALAFAAEAAQGRHVSLVCLIGGAPDGDARARSEASLTSVRERYPDLAVHSQAISERPAEALLRSDGEAQLIVVPSVGRRAGGPGSTAGWTGHFLPILSGCPVAVVSTRTRLSTTLA